MVILDDIEAEKQQQQGLLLLREEKVDFLFLKKLFLMPFIWRAGFI
jgi:hypothetical protein